MRKSIAALAAPLGVAASLLAGATQANAAPVHHAPAHAVAHHAAATKLAPTAPRAVRGWVGHPSKGVKLPGACFGKGTTICVDKSAHRLYWLKDGKLVDDFSVRTGRPGMATRSGTWHVQYKDAMSWSRPYHVYMPYSMYFSGGEAIHYSSDFAANGYGRGSHGCVNMRDRAGARALFQNTKVGTLVDVYGG